MNGSQTAPDRGDGIGPDESDWALAAVPDGLNATGLLAEDLEEYPGGLTEIQTVVLACVATVIPLFLGLLLILGVRMVWKKYKNHNTNSGYDNDGLHREDSCDAVKSSSFMQSVEELKPSESQYSVLMPDDAAAVATCCYATDSTTVPPLLYNSPPNNRFGDTNKTNLNGSIITLTMKNNHLIVETEERVPGVCGVESAAATNASTAMTTVNGGGPADKSLDYEYDDDEFDMEAEMLRREFREASLLANGGGDRVPATAAAVLEPSGQTQVDASAADRRPLAAAAPAYYPPQLQPATVDHSSGGSSSVDSRVVGHAAYAYGNQSEYTVEHGKPGVQIATAKSAVTSAFPSAANAMTANNNNNNNNNSIDDEYLAEQRLLGNGTDGARPTTESPFPPPPPPPPSSDICSPEERTVVTAT